jgi:hypothetical protein
MERNMDEKIQWNVQVDAGTKEKVEAIGRATYRNRQGDVISWLVNEKFAELFEFGIGKDPTEGEPMRASNAGN